MVVKREHAPGTFSWANLTTPDAAAARAFYSELFGWSVEPSDGYTMMRKGGRDVAGLQENRDAPPGWLAHFTVRDVDEMAKRAKALGADVVVEVHDVRDAGRVVRLRDPTLAEVALWQPARHHGVGRLDEPGAIAWTELVTSNVDLARHFYASLFEWGAEVTDLNGESYVTFTRDGQPVAGALPMRAGLLAPQWIVYFDVTDCEDVARRARQIGGEILAPPTDAPNLGRFAWLRDSRDVSFAILQR